MRVPFVFGTTPGVQRLPERRRLGRAPSPTLHAASLRVLRRQFRPREPLLVGGFDRIRFKDWMHFKLLCSGLIPCFFFIFS